MGSQVISLLTQRGRRLSGRALVHASRAALVLVLFLANAIGALVVFALLALVLPGTDLDDASKIRLFNGVLAAIYLLVALVLGLVIGLTYARPMVRWLKADRDPTEQEQLRALRAPLVVLGLEAALWIVAAALFGGLNVIFDGKLALRVAIAVLLGGVTTSAVSYLLSEYVLRPVAARALSIGPPSRAAAPGVSVKLALSWALGTAAPVLGLVLIGIAALVDEDASAHDLALTMLSLGAVALIVGLLATAIAIRSVSGPVRSVRNAVREVEQGELEVEVRVDDGSELGRLQAGVNRMVRGLREREELRDLFGRHVGEDVARAALDRGVELGGELRDVAVLFVDVVGSTTLASERPPEEVVELLNKFFGVVVEVVDEHGGWINKFEGDAALAIFGAPTPLDDRDTCILTAARVMGERLREEVAGLEAGIGVSAGEAVAGNIGATARFEYTVIGDPVNEAARLTEVAKEKPGRVVAAARLVEAASESERARWEVCGSVELRGRPEPTDIAVPASG